MVRNRIQSAGWMLALLLATTLQLRAQQAQPGATLSGVVRDQQGVPQAGALVQLLALRRGNSIDSVMSAAAAFTDSRGRYAFARIEPGEYEVRATAATFLPVLREHLRLVAGSRALANMTLSTLFQTSEWLPAERRSAGEADDDWQWTLRSTVNRPLLRLVGVEGHGRAETRGRVAVSAGDGGFAAGGEHSILTVDHMLADGSELLMRADVAAARAWNASGLSAGAPAAEMSAGYEHSGGVYGNRMHVVAEYSSHPELVRGDEQAGMQSARLLSAQQVQLTDALGIDVGAAITAVQMGADAAEMQQFVKVVIRPSEKMVVSYSMATERDLQASTDLDGAEMGAPEAALRQGQARMESGLHQELAVSRRGARGMAEVAWYHDRISNPMVNGVGEIGTAELASGDYVADPATGSFRVVGEDYAGSGVSLSAGERLGDSLWAVVNYSTGPVLVVKPQLAAAPLQAGMNAEQVQSAALTLRGTMARTNTRVRAGYRWQPQHAVTVVNAYGALGGAYLSVDVRQPLRVRGLLPRGTEAMVDVSNLLAQGYEPVATDGEGRAIYYAQAERTLEAGLSFTF